MNCLATRVVTREIDYGQVGTSLTFDSNGVVHADKDLQRDPF